MVCAFVQVWQADAPAVVEYFPLSQALQVFPSFKKPALQILDKPAGGVSRQETLDSVKKKRSHQGQLLLLGVSTPHEAYWLLLAGLFVQATHGFPSTTAL